MVMTTNQIPSWIMKVSEIPGGANLGLLHEHVFTVAEVDLMFESPVLNKYSGLQNKSNYVSSSCGVKLFLSEKTLEFIGKITQGKEIGVVTIMGLQTAGTNTNKTLYEIELQHTRISHLKVNQELSASNMPEEYKEFTLDDNLSRILHADADEFDQKRILESFQAIISPKKYTGIVEMEFEYSQIKCVYSVVEPNSLPRGVSGFGWDFQTNTAIHTI